MGMLLTDSKNRNIKMQKTRLRCEVEELEKLNSLIPLQFNFIDNVFLLELNEDITTEIHLKFAQFIFVVTSSSLI